MCLSRHGSRDVAGNFTGALDKVSDDSKEPLSLLYFLQVQSVSGPDGKKHQEQYAKARDCPGHSTEIILMFRLEEILKIESNY